MSVNKILSKLFGKLIAYLPMSLLAKLADGKLSKEELNQLKEELIVVVLDVVDDFVVVEK